MIDLPPPGQGADHALALRHQPIVRIDQSEPYLPLVMGYTLLRAPQKSPSCRHQITPQGATCIEYAIWYDWDIQHLYDLEHIWVHLDANGSPTAVEASFHGQKVAMPAAWQGARPVLYAEPGKHAHWADGQMMQAQMGARLTEWCTTGAGAEGVHLGNPFAAAGQISATPLDHRLARRKMQRDAFTPSFAFTDAPDARLTPWPDLAAWIPARVAALIHDLPHTVPHLAAIFLDCGDTLIDEATEEKLPGTDIVTRAEEIPYAMQSVRDLQALGYPLALVADGPVQTFENLLKPRGIWDLFQTHAISETVGALKPDARMFHTAMTGLALPKGDAARIVMVGNNLSRDIKGANDFGLISLFVGWSRRRTHTPADQSEDPNHSILALEDLVPMIEDIERSLPATAVRPKK